MAIRCGPTHTANFSSLSLLCEAEEVFFIFLTLYILPFNFLQAAERILKKAEQTHKQRVEVCLKIPLLTWIVIKWLFALNYCFNSDLWDTYRSVHKLVDSDWSHHSRLNSRSVLESSITNQPLRVESSIILRLARHMNVLFRFLGMHNFMWINSPSSYSILETLKFMQGSCIRCQVEQYHKSKVSMSDGDNSGKSRS